VLGVASLKRMAQLPNVPTLGESGFLEFENASWIAFFGPARLPEPVARLLNAEINAALSQTDVRDRLSAIGLETRTMSQSEFAEYMRAEVGKWAQVIKTTGITPN
jgi:tripartite-type tricarboxylate transporter receptor subunit TctC